MSKLKNNNLKNTKSKCFGYYPFHVSNNHTHLELDEKKPTLHVVTSLKRMKDRLTLSPRWTKQQTDPNNASGMKMSKKTSQHCRGNQDSSQRMESNTPRN